VSDEPTNTEALEEQAEAVEETAPADPALEVQLEPDPLAEAEARAAEYLELAKRKQAEFENFRKRMAAHGAQSEARGVTRVAKELLAPLDHLGLAVEHADEASRAPLESLRQEFITALARVGVEAFAPLGEAFDPTQHEAMAQQPAEGAESGTVTEVFQAGYRMGETIIRPARVVVAA
jgi:molecular chaperone GrpE